MTWWSQEGYGSEQSLPQEGGSGLLELGGFRLERLQQEQPAHQPE